MDGEMTRLRELNRWVAPPIIAVLLASGVGPIAHANVSVSPLAVPSCDKERGRPPDRPIPNRDGLQDQGRPRQSLIPS